MFGSRAFLLAPVSCLKAGRRKIVERLTLLLRAHQLVAAADKDRQILMPCAQSLLLVSVLSLVVAACGGGGGDSSASPSAGTLFPLHTEAGKRYLVDAAGKPFLMLGESPQAMIGNLTEAEAELFLVNRKSHGFNTVWVNLLCASYNRCKADGTTFDGIAPFTGSDLSTYDLSAPNEAYFARADRMLQLAAKYGFLVI